MQAGSTLWRHLMFGYASMRRLILATIHGSQYNYMPNTCIIENLHEIE